MIPRAHIAAWRAIAPWAVDAQVEQDLVLSRAIISIFRNPVLRDGLLFRGGTALNKFYFDPAARYSEDIDLVQRESGPIGPIADNLRSALDWLGTGSYKRGPGTFTLDYRFETSFQPIVTMKVKVEINTREHFTHFPVLWRPFEVQNRWFSGSVTVPTYTFSELMGTKLRALYQRKKGRDLFDLGRALGHAEFVPDKVVEAFAAYMSFEDGQVSRAQFEQNMAEKMKDVSFRNDVLPLLSPSVVYDPEEAWKQVHAVLVARLPGEAWRGLGLLP